MQTSVQMPADRRPIGYWIKAADRALDGAIDALHARAGINRPGWQLLNAVWQSGDGVPISSLREEFAPIMTVADFDDRLEMLERAGMVSVEHAVLCLTGNGMARHAAMDADQKALRRRIMTNISPDDYAVALKVLREICAALER
ncbi:hypothetical protein RHIZO_04163 [Rhizobiaceae bacterium]|nr:hypothetical protein RHIZO_04163 [Rhizobiaceae bacterium]